MEKSWPMRKNPVKKWLKNSKENGKFQGIFWCEEGRNCIFSVSCRFMQDQYPEDQRLAVVVR
jgi:hypothetical protein